MPNNWNCSHHLQYETAVFCFVKKTLYSSVPEKLGSVIIMNELPPTFVASNIISESFPEN